jgi:carbon monoxide dehydrogenase subunit G
MVHRIFQTIEIQAPADDVWRFTGRPELIAEFHPDVVSASLEGNLRISTLVDGSRVIDKIVDRSVVHRFYTYELAGGAPAIEKLRACLAVRGHGDHSHVDWDVQLEAALPDDEARTLACRLDDAIGEALARLRAHLEAAAAAA